MAKLPLDIKKIGLCRELASKITAPVEKLIATHSSDSIERASLRLIGLNGAIPKSNGQFLPTVNAIIQELRPKIHSGAMYWVCRYLIASKSNIQKFEKLFIEAQTSQTPFDWKEEIDVEEEAIVALAKRFAKEAEANLINARRKRDALRTDLKDRFQPPFSGQPLKYVIVATGNIYDDVIQARAAAEAGAEAIAVIRSTAQSLLDFVPHGPTTEGFGGTYATQENFRIMREALDETSRKLGRYVRLTNYCSGLCMAEIAALGSLERLDFLLNDAMYGILFRDINLQRTLIDQHFSRRIIAKSKIVIHTGEDNYLTTADAVENGHQVLASQFINERFALDAKMTRDQLGLGHAQEMDPTYPDVFLLEIARAQMTRDIFPDSPIKFMPPTRHKCGDIFYSHLMDAMFNFVGVLTNQSIQLLGMMTEAMHTPLLQDRWIAIRNAQYIFNGAASLGEEFEFKSDGKIIQWAQNVLDDTLTHLKMIHSKGLFKAIEERAFAEVSRTETGGKGHAGVFEKGSNYLNPFFEVL